MISDETYDRERATLIEIELASADQHDKAILTLTAGALGLSITFVDKIAANPLPETLWLVAVAWVCLILAIVCILGSFLTSQSACRREREILDNRYSSCDVSAEENRPPPKNRYSDWTKWLTFGAYIPFVVGVIFLALFAWWNLQAANQTRKVRNNILNPLKDKIVDMSHYSPAQPVSYSTGDGRSVVRSRQLVNSKPNVPFGTPSPSPTN